MTRPLLEVADIVRAQGSRFIENNCRWIHWTHRKVLRAIARCRTAALGGHRDKCPRCGYRAISPRHDFVVESFAACQHHSRAPSQ